MGLRKSDMDLNAATVSIERSVVQVGGGLVVKEPKTAAGVRTIALPRSLMPEIARHLDRFAEVGPDGRMFVGPAAVRLNYWKASFLTVMLGCGPCVARELGW
jgi:hypothetical protein